MEVIVTIVCKLVYFTYLLDVSNLLINKGGSSSIDPKYQQDIPVILLGGLWKTLRNSLRVPEKLPIGPESIVK